MMRLVPPQRIVLQAKVPREPAVTLPVRNERAVNRCPVTMGADAHISHLPVRTFWNFSEPDKPGRFLPRRPFQPSGFGLRETATCSLDFPLSRLESPHASPKYQGLGERGM